MHHTRPDGYRRLLTFANAKTTKGERLGYLTGILYLAPHTLSGHNVCASAKNCIGACLNTAGRGRLHHTQQARLEKTRMLFDDRETFLSSLRHDIRALIRKARRTRIGRQRMKPAVRINGTSDLPWLAHLMANEFPQVQFYDYTKHIRPWQRVRSNYALTFSHDGAHNLQACMDALCHGVNVAVVFHTPKGQ